MTTAPSWTWPAHNAAPVVAVPAPATLPVSLFSRLVTGLFYLLGIGTAIAFVLVAHHSLQQPTPATAQLTTPATAAQPTEPSAAEVSVASLQLNTRRAPSSLELAGTQIAPRASTAAKPAPRHAVTAQRPGDATAASVNTLMRSVR